MNFLQTEKREQIHLRFFTTRFLASLTHFVQSKSVHNHNIITRFGSAQFNYFCCSLQSSSRVSRVQTRRAVQSTVVHQWFSGSVFSDADNQTTTTFSQTCAFRPRRSTAGTRTHTHTHTALRAV